MKHAFEEDGGRITVKLQTGLGFGECRLTVFHHGERGTTTSVTLPIIN